jgi:hypothetical protein
MLDSMGSQVPAFIVRTMKVLMISPSPSFPLPQGSQFSPTLVLANLLPSHDPIMSSRGPTLEELDELMSSDAFRHPFQDEGYQSTPSYDELMSFIGPLEFIPGGLSDDDIQRASNAAVEALARNSPVLVETSRGRIPVVSDTKMLWNSWAEMMGLSYPIFDTEDVPVPQGEAEALQHHEQVSDIRAPPSTLSPCLGKIRMDSLV